jgi:maleylacetoacetate isomerase
MLFAVDFRANMTMSAMVSKIRIACRCFPSERSAALKVQNLTTSTICREIATPHSTQQAPRQRHYPTDAQPAMSSQSNTYTLYTFYNSSCSARVRIAAALKSIPLNYKFIDLLTAGQNAPEYASLNPSEFVPLLLVHSPTSENPILRLSQSTAILEYLDEVHPSAVKLLPKDPLTRAKVRELMGVIACDTQPVTNQRIVKYIKPRGLDEAEWQGHFMATGMRAYELLCREGAGRWSVGDEISLADVYLIAACDRARRYKLDIEQWPTIARIERQMRETEAYRAGGFRSQPDTPDAVREAGRL